MIQIRDLKDVERVLNVLTTFMDEMKRNNVDLHGRRFTNVGKSQDVNEFVTRDELDIESRKLNELITAHENEIIAIKRRLKILEPQSHTQ